MTTAAFTQVAFMKTALLTTEAGVDGRSHVDGNLRDAGNGLLVAAAVRQAGAVPVASGGTEVEPW